MLERLTSAGDLVQQGDQQVLTDRAIAADAVRVEKKPLRAVLFVAGVACGVVGKLASSPAASFSLQFSNVSSQTRPHLRGVFTVMQAPVEVRADSRCI